MRKSKLNSVFTGVPLTIIVFLFTFCRFGTAETAVNSSFQYHQLKGIEANNYGQYSDAVDHLQRAMSLNPGIAETHFELAFAYDNLDQQDLAIKNYETGLKINPNFIPAYIMLAKAYVNQDGDLGKALRAAREAKRRDPGSNEATQILEAIEAKIRTLPSGAELLEDEKKYAKKGVGIYQSGDFTFVGPVKKGETIRDDVGGEEIELVFDKREWLKKVDIKNSNPQIAQYFLEKESPENWTEAVTVHTLKNAVGQFTPETIANKLTRVSKPKMNIINQSKADLMYDGFTEEGKRYELVRVVFGKERIHTLYYASRNMKTVQDKKKEWLELLNKAKIIEGR